MEISLIEQYDKSRYNLIKWLTVGWAAWFGTYILKDLINDKFLFVQILIGFVGLIGFIFFVINLQKYLRLASKIKYSRLNDALNNELHQIYKYKSFFFGFKVLLSTICVFFTISLFCQISAKFVCEITLYLGVLSSLIAGLVYNRD
ncbi:MAG: hypothetical protein Q8928_12100 [Bacteroidota bacterium]|nr:hypothetical protein [Bacteroidota bacterium]